MLLDKILSIASLGQAVAGVTVTRKFISDLVVVLALAIIGAILAGGLVIGCLLILHMVFLSHGLEPALAAGLTIGVALLLLGGVVAGIMYRIRMMRGLPSPLVQGEALISSTVHSVIRGFYKGLTAPLPPKPPKHP
ncbi:MAG: hypothetical protein P4M15_07355 [Alphaproteobacteria bacterium]|nr:hypothetical protein [Alphaproteobacteria bacterium]